MKPLEIGDKRTIDGIELEITDVESYKHHRLLKIDAGDIVIGMKVEFNRGFFYISYFDPEKSVTEGKVVDGRFVKEEIAKGDWVLLAPLISTYEKVIEEFWGFVPVPKKEK